MATKIFYFTPSDNATGLSPTLTLIKHNWQKDSSQTLVSGVTLSELGSGVYFYKFSNYEREMNYVAVADFGAGYSSGRYANAINESYLDDIETLKKGGGGGGATAQQIVTELLKRKVKGKTIREHLSNDETGEFVEQVGDFLSEKLDIHSEALESVLSEVKSLEGVVKAEMPNVPQIEDMEAVITPIFREIGKSLSQMENLSKEEVSTIIDKASQEIKSEIEDSKVEGKRNVAKVLQSQSNMSSTIATLSGEAVTREAESVSRKSKIEQAQKILSNK